MTRLKYLLSGLSQRLLWRASIYGIIAVATALVAAYAKQFIPNQLPQQVGADSVDGILNILASSMLAVTIFSVSTMVAAYGSATNNVTPRSTSLLIEDKVSQNTLSSFIGTFIYSIVGIVALRIGAYGETGRVLLLIVTIGVIIGVILTLLRWIEYLSKLGRMNETVARVEAAARESLQARIESPYLGGVMQEYIPNEAQGITAADIGYVQYVDMGRLAALAKKGEGDVYLTALPGKFVDPCSDLVRTTVNTAEYGDKIRDCFIINTSRTFKQDPRFGIAVLAEIGSRALSKATNDSGTAIYILGIGTRVLAHWAKRNQMIEGEEPQYPNVYVPPIATADLFDDFFMPISRDSAGLLEVDIRLQKSFATLACLGDTEMATAAKTYAALSLKRSLAALTLEEDRERLLAEAFTG